MRKKCRWEAVTALLCLAAAAVIALTYSGFVRRKIREESSSRLTEFYAQVNAGLGALAGQSWNLLDGWEREITGLANTDCPRFDDYIAQQRSRWGFSDFYFIGQDGSCCSTGGEEGALDGNLPLQQVLEGGDGAVLDGTLSGGEGIVLFAIPVPPGAYREFPYSAAAIGYSGGDMAQVLSSDAFSGQSECLLVRPDGHVLLSTRRGRGGRSPNLLAYLEENAAFRRGGRGALRRDWAGGATGVEEFRLEGISYYISYQPAGLQDWMLLGIVPADVAGEGMNEVRWAALAALAGIFISLGVMVAAALARRSRRALDEKSLELSCQEQLFGTLSDSVDDIFILLGDGGRRADYISPNIQRLLGITPEQLRGDPQLLRRSALEGGDPFTREEVRSIPVGGHIRREREYIHQQTGERRWYLATLYHVMVQDTERFLLVLSDRTNERHMDANLRHALDAAKSANEAKSHFLANMSHDIRTPMNAILGFASLLRMEADDPDKVRDYTEKLTAASQHLLDLMNNVLDMSKIESGKTSLDITEFNLPSFLEELNAGILPQALAKRQRFEIRVQGRAPEDLLGDRLRVGQILRNLLSNAVSYTPEDGEISLLVQNLPQTSPRRAHLRFVVRDNGIGMSPEFLKTLFDPFTREISSVTNTVHGAGLGMAITKNMVDLMGGIISVESTPGSGTAVTVELEFAIAHQVSDEQFWLQQGITRLLVVDDEEDICLEIQGLMAGTGVGVTYTTDGPTAVDWVVSAHRRGEDYHAVLLDWRMPGMDGVETARRIREQVGREVPLLVLTAYDWREAEAEARAAGVDLLLPKPFFVSVFRESIRLFRAGPGAEKETGGEASLEGMLFLVAEDNDLNAEILSELLDVEGARCERTVNGQEAVRRFEQAPPGYYDMILMDIQMPVMNGYEAARCIRALDHPDAAGIPIVAMTANAFAEDIQRAMAAGMDAHVAKPVDMDVLRQALTALRGGRRQA